jgi:hypothetical protein
MLRILAAMILCGAAVSAANAGAPPESVPVQLAMLQGPTANSCLQAPIDPEAHDYRLQQAQCTTVDRSQMYRFEADLEGGHRIRSMQTDACIDVLTWSSPGEPVLSLPCNGQDTQRWEVNYSEANPSTVMMRSALSGLCLDFAGGIAVQASCDFQAGTGPTWMANRQASRVPNGAVAFKSALGAGCMSLDDAPATIPCTNDGRSNLRFEALDAAGSTFRFDGPADGTCLVEVDGVVVYDACITGPAAQWRLVETQWGNPAANGETAVQWQVQNVATGQCIHAGRGSVVPEGETLTTWTCDASPNALWYFAKY